MVNITLFFGIIVLLGLNVAQYLIPNLIKSTLEDSNVKNVVLFVCWNKHEKVFLQKYIQEKLNVKIAFRSVNEEVTKSGDNSYDKINIILDLSCEKSREILVTSSKTYTFRRIYKWLIITNSSFQNIDKIESIFKGIKLRLDMDVKIAIPSQNKELFYIYEVYKPGLDVDVVIKLQNLLSQNFYQSRKNLSGVLIRSASVHNFSFDTPLNYIEALRSKGTLTFSKYNFQLFTTLQEIHHFWYLALKVLNFNTTVRTAWFGNTSSGIDAGVSQLLHERKVDISSAGGLLRYDRMPYYDYLVPFFKFRACFIFRNPGTVKPGAEVLKPFSLQTWYATTGYAVVMGIAIKIAYWMEYRFLKSRINYSLFTSIVITISALAQQGSAIFPHHLGGRIIYLNLLIFSILVYNYYTSSLVSSLLSTKPSVLETIQELYESKLKVGVEDQPYTTTYILQQKNDTYIQKLNSCKIYENEKPNFFTPKEGVLKIKEGGFAYHSEAYTAYPLIEKSFEQDLICDLAEIDFVPAGLIGIMAPKNSEYRELFSISLTKMMTRGIYQREYNVWVIKKPVCLLSTRVVSVGRNELFLVYMILIVGIFAAVIVLLMEIIWRKIQTNTVFFATTNLCIDKIY